MEATGLPESPKQQMSVCYVSFESFWVSCPFGWQSINGSVTDLTRGTEGLSVSVYEENKNEILGDLE